MKRIACVLLGIFILSSSVVSYAVKEENEVSTDYGGIRMEINKGIDEVKLTESSKDKLPKYVKKFLKDNKNYRILNSKAYHYQIERNEEGEIEQKLIKSFELKDDKSIVEYEIYRDNIETQEITPMAFKPRKSIDIFLGLSTYGFSHPNRPTAYQIQGWWEWDQSALGIFNNKWDVVGLNFQGETLGYDWVAFANNIWTGDTLTLNLLNSDDNGSAFAHTQQALSEGAILGKLISSNSDSNDNFVVYFIYEYFDSSPSSSYLGQLVDYIINVWIPYHIPVYSTNARFESSRTLYYGN